MQIRITGFHLILLGVLVLGVGGYFLLDWLIVTDVERVEATVEELARVVEKNDVASVMPHLDASFRMGDLDLEAFHEWYTKTLKVVQVREGSIYDTEAEVDKADPNLARALVLTFVELENPRGFHRINWQLEFRRHGEHTWKVSSVRALWPKDGREIPLKSVPHWLP